MCMPDGSLKPARLAHGMPFDEASLRVARPVSSSLLGVEAAADYCKGQI
jgi:hypothetical protein